MNLLERYGIKEVMDVTFWELDENGILSNPVLVLDTLKISNLEETSSSVDAVGGKGNAALITWDFGKNITLSLQDALFSAQSLSIAHGSSIKELDENVDQVFRLQCSENGVAPTYTNTLNGETITYDSDDLSYFDESGEEASEYVAGQYYFAKKTHTASDLEDKSYKIEIDSNTFPGTYCITGITYARDEVTGKDCFYNITIPKAKVLSGQTFTMQAEGDPSVFDMQIRVLRPQDRVMVRLIQFEPYIEKSLNDLGLYLSYGSSSAVGKLVYINLINKDPSALTRVYVNFSNEDIVLPVENEAWLSYTAEHEDYNFSDIVVQGYPYDVYKNKIATVVVTKTEGAAAPFYATQYATTIIV